VVICLYILMASPFLVGVENHEYGRSPLSYQKVLHLLCESATPNQ
jgi:hypothetical protein